MPCVQVNCTRMLSECSCVHCCLVNAASETYNNRILEPQMSQFESLFASLTLCISHMIFELELKTTQGTFKSTRGCIWWIFAAILLSFSKVRSAWPIAIGLRPIDQRHKHLSYLMLVMNEGKCPVHQFNTFPLSLFLLCYVTRSWCGGGKEGIYIYIFLLPSCPSLVM